MRFSFDEEMSEEIWNTLLCLGTVYFTSELCVVVASTAVVAKWAWEASLTVTLKCVIVWVH